MGQLTRSTTVAASHVHAVADDARKTADSAVFENFMRLHKDIVPSGTTPKSIEPTTHPSATSFNGINCPATRMKHIGFGLFHLKRLTQKLATGFILTPRLRGGTNNSVVTERPMESVDDVAIEDDIPSETGKDDCIQPTLRGILKPYKGSRHGRFGFSYNRPFPVDHQRGDNQERRRVSFGTQLNVTVYHYTQVDVDEAPISGPTSSSAFSGLARFMPSGGHGVPAAAGNIPPQQESTTGSAAPMTPQSPEEEDYKENLFIPLPPLSSPSDDALLATPPRNNDDLSLDDLRQSFRTRTPSLGSSFSPGMYEKRRQAAPRKSSSARGTFRKSEKQAARLQALVLGSHRMM